MTLNKLERRIIDISYKKGLSHIGSCLGAVNTIEKIYGEMVDRANLGIPVGTDKFVLSSGHMGLALYVVLEDYFGLDAEEIFNAHGVHPEYCTTCHLDCSSGSLGQGLPIAVGMALANRNRNVYCVISDGEAAEGSIWEALRIKREQKVDNLFIYCIYNGWSAYGPTDEALIPQLLRFGSTVNVIRVQDKLPEISGQDAHYHKLTKEEYERITA
jgi:transketolase